MKALGTAIAILLLFTGVGMAQNGTVNYLSVNPRQNQEMTNTTGTETGQPSPAEPGSENMPNGLIPVTSNMAGSGSNGNMNQRETTSPAIPSTPKMTEKNAGHSRTVTQPEKQPHKK